MCKLPGYKCYLITDWTQLSDADQNELRTQNISLDDWDYMIIFEDDSILQESTIEQYDWDLSKHISVPFFTPSDYNLERLLQGCYDNKWQKIIFRKKNVAIGIAYHS